MPNAQLFQLGSILLLAVLLFFPISKIIWVLSVRRLQRKRGQTLSEQEIAGQLRRARIIGFVIALVFSYLFHLNVLSALYR